MAFIMKPLMPFLVFRWTASEQPCQMQTPTPQTYLQPYRRTTEAHHWNAAKGRTDFGPQLPSPTDSSEIPDPLQDVLSILQTSRFVSLSTIPKYPDFICNIPLPNTFTQEHQCPHCRHKILVRNGGLRPRFHPIQPPLQSHSWHKENSRSSFQETTPHPNHPELIA